MCKGLAICINAEGKVLCDGTSHHSKLKDGLNEEEWLDYEVTLPCWYEPILDKRDNKTIQIWKKNGLLTLRGQPKKRLHQAVVQWLQDNELQVKTWFLFNDRLQAYATIKGDQYHCNQTIEGNQDHSGQTINGIQYHSGQTIKGNQDHSGQTIKGNQYHKKQTINGSQYHSGQTIKGNQHHIGQTIKGDQDHQYQTIKKDQFHKGQTIEGSQYHIGQTIKGDIHIYDLRQGNKKLQKQLNRFYKTEQDKYTWGTFFAWVIKEE